MKQAMNKPEYGIRWNENDRPIDLEFADDIALLAEDRQSLQDMTSSLETSGANVGLRISCERTKAMTIGQVPPPLSISRKRVEQVKKFAYLGSNMPYEGDTEVDVNSRLGKAASVFPKMNTVFTITYKIFSRSLANIYCQ